jgi:hypothetical protein
VQLIELSDGVRWKEKRGTDTAPGFGAQARRKMKLLLIMEQVGNTEFI